ncbi:signal peptide, CUB domain, EGF-like 3 [Cichlidogyrus casuarinus]|uniref:Signal peptide, CUB domain, EGF-like 3 n=1 Tax=Cichlidogyrus casuarinus TaxID=1844966 RepID=A0ABD2PKV0_9PLAT
MAVALRAQNIDECSLTPAVCDQVCVNSLGNYNCECIDPFFRLTVNDRCDDVNECLVNPCPFPETQECHNFYGGYFCFCKPGFINSNGECVTHQLSISDEHRASIGNWTCDSRPCNRGICVNEPQNGRLFSCHCGAYELGDFCQFNSGRFLRFFRDIHRKVSQPICEFILLVIFMGQMEESFRRGLYQELQNSFVSMRLMHVYAQQRSGATDILFVKLFLTVKFSTGMEQGDWLTHPKMISIAEPVYEENYHKRAPETDGFDSRKVHVFVKRAAHFYNITAPVSPRQKNENYQISLINFWE